MKKFLPLLFVLILISCSEKKNPEKIENKTDNSVIEPDILSPYNEDNNIDSPAFYDNGSRGMVLATAKGTHKLVIYDAETGDSIGSYGDFGRKFGEFKRPNGIWVIDSLCFVVERDNHKVQVLKLPEFETIGIFGKFKLIKPYGISVVRTADIPVSSEARATSDYDYRIYVTDNYETEDEQIPADSALYRRVSVFDMKIRNEDNDIITKFRNFIGPTEGEGRLKVVESIYADPANDNLLVAEELEGAGKTMIKVFDLDGNFKKNIGEGLFKSQAEGIALYKCDDKNGFWISTDQSKESNIFHFFDRRTFEPLAQFDSGKLSNTDGIWLHQNPIGEHKAGQFIAVNNDGGIGIWDLGKLMDKLELSCE